MKQINKGSSTSTVKQILSYLSRRIGLIILSLLCAAVITLLSLAIPILVGQGIDQMLEEGKVDFAALSPILLKIALSVAVTALAQWIMSMLNNRITYETVKNLRTDAFRKIKTLPLSYLDSHPIGEIVSRVIADADQFSEGLLMALTQFFTGVLTILGTLVFMFFIHPLTTLLVVILTPLSLFVARFIAKKTYSMFRLQSSIRGEQTAHLEEMIKGQKIVSAFSMQQKTISDFDEINERLEKASLRAVFFSSTTNPATRFIYSLILAAVCISGPLAVISGGMTVGGFTSFISYAGQYGKPFNEISGVISELQNAIACAGRILDLIAQPSESSDQSLPALPDTAGSVAFEDLSFSYVPEKPFMQALNIQVSPGEHIAIVGKTGCGKTTLVNLLMRFYEPTGGKITIDGVDISTVTRHSVRDQIGMVLQDTWLRAGTVRENLAFGSDHLTQEEIEEAARLCHAHSFIKRLPKGYDTPLSEGGSELSAGQRQLLCITRVMLAKPRILILDEATSSIDVRTEQKVQSAFDALMKGKTSFIIAHRLSTIVGADRILVMDAGNIIESGTHAELLSRSGAYADLYHSQFEH